MVSSCRMRARSGSRLRLQYQKMRCVLFQTNLPILRWSVSSGLINLLVVRLAISLRPGSLTLAKQGPQGAGTAVHGPNRFLLRPAAFRYT